VKRGNARQVGPASPRGHPPTDTLADFAVSNLDLLKNFDAKIEALSSHRGIADFDRGHSHFYFIFIEIIPMAGKLAALVCVVIESRVRKPSFQ